MFARRSLEDLHSHHDGDCRYLSSRAKLRPVAGLAGRRGQHLAYHKCISVSAQTAIELTAAEQRRSGRLFLSALSLINHLRPERPVCVRVSVCPSVRSVRRRSEIKNANGDGHRRGRLKARSSGAHCTPVLFLSAVAVAVVPPSG